MRADIKDARNWSIRGVDMSRVLWVLVMVGSLAACAGEEDMDGMPPSLLDELCLEATAPDCEAESDIAACMRALYGNCMIAETTPAPAPTSSDVRCMDQAEAWCDDKAFGIPACMMSYYGSCTVGWGLGTEIPDKHHEACLAALADADPQGNIPDEC